MCLRLALVLTLVMAPWSSTAARPADPDQLREGETEVETDELFPGAVPLDEDGEETVWCVRIVDAVDRTPIPGARVSVPYHPGWGPEEEQHIQCAAVADWDGWARLPMAGVKGWRDYVFADAKGYAADEYCQPGDDECALRAGVYVPVIVLDYTGRRVPGARIGLNLACGHIPDQRTARTDKRGRALLRDIMPSRHKDIWIEARHCHRGTSSLRRTWRLGDPTVVIDAPPGITTSGQIFGPDGEPLRGVVIGAKDLHRPVTTTDRDGRYRLVGVSAWSEIEYMLPPHLGVEDASFIAPPKGVERIIRLDKAQKPRSRVTIVCTGPDDESAVGVRVAIVREIDGLTFTGLTLSSGKHVFEAAPGTYQLLVDGELGTYGSSEGRIEVVEGHPVSNLVRVPRNPTVRVDASQVAGLTVGITTRNGFRALDIGQAGEGAVEVPVPNGVRATFRISGREDGELLVTYVDVPAPGETVRLEWVPLKRLTARLVGPDGKAVPGVLTIERESWLDINREGELEDATLQPFVETRLSGTVAWTATPADRELTEVRGDVRLTAMGGEVALGDLSVARRPAPGLLVEAPPALLKENGATVSCRLPGMGGEISFDVREDGTLDPEDVACGSALSPDMRFVVTFEAPGVVPQHFRPTGPAPWTVPWPKATLEVVVHSEDDGKLLEEVVLVLDGEVVWSWVEKSQPRLLRGLTAGMHDLVVAHRDHVARRYRLHIKDGEARKLHVELRPRD